MMGIKEGTSLDEYWVLYVSGETLVLLLKPILHCVLTNLNLNKYIKKGKKNDNKVFRILHQLS